MTNYLPLGGQRASDSEERIQSALRAALSALHNLLTAISYPVLTAQTYNEIKDKKIIASILCQYVFCALVCKCKYIKTFGTFSFP